MKKNIIIEIGAYDGNDTQKYAGMSNTFVYCFEPNEDLFIKLKQRFLGYQNVKVLKQAIGEINGDSTFYITKNKMSSSLNKLSNYSIKNNINEIEYSTIVNVIRFDTFLEKNNITNIHYLHCDAQGSDLEILKSIGDKISIISSGQVEGSRNKNLYETENHYTKIIEYLESKGFLILNKEEIENRTNWLDLNILFKNKKTQNLI